ncbi:MAG TPA: TlpA disulfide reductase family protein [Alphaproteobacteria bacterium]|nr:TlpA disulfide reductase family protein [Alphaproteobacteria bacterium]
MSLQAKDLLARLREHKAGLIVGGIVLALLLAAGPVILRMEGLFSSNPLKHLAIGAMAKFAFGQQGMQAPSVAFDGPEGPMTLARLKGRPVLVNLWASWCQPCVKELPSLDRLQLAMKGEGLSVVAINMDQDKDDALYFLAKNHVTHLALYFDSNLLMSIALHEESIPVSVLYDASGREVGRYVGSTNWDSEEARRLIAAAIKPAGEDKHSAEQGQ